jgi:hypothetical protein
MSAPPATLELIRPAASAQAEGPNRLLVVLTGFAAGLVVGMLIWGFRRRPIAASTGI